nr:MAG TPA: hypothetical protein [Caudoviricetes sp.]
MALSAILRQKLGCPITKPTVDDCICVRYMIKQRGASSEQILEACDNLANTKDPFYSKPQFKTIRFLRNNIDTLLLLKENSNDNEF